MIGSGQTLNQSMVVDAVTVRELLKEDESIYQLKNVELTLQMFTKQMTKRDIWIYQKHLLDLFEKGE